MICNPIDLTGFLNSGAELVIKNLSKVHSLPTVVAVPHNIIGQDKNMMILLET